MALGTSHHINTCVHTSFTRSFSVYPTWRMWGAGRQSSSDANLFSTWGAQGSGSTPPAPAEARAVLWFKKLKKKSAGIFWISSNKPSLLFQGRPWKGGVSCLKFHLCINVSRPHQERGRARGSEGGDRQSCSRGSFTPESTAIYLASTVPTGDSHRLRTAGLWSLTWQPVPSQKQMNFTISSSVRLGGLLIFLAPIHPEVGL